MNFKLSVAALAAVFAMSAAYAQSTGAGSAPAPAVTAPAGSAPAGAPPAAAGDAMPGPGGMRHDGPHGAHGPRGHHGPHGGFMKRMDTDKDGAISMAELKASQQRQTEMFEKADTNKDGKVSREEMRAAFEAMHKERHRNAPAPQKSGEAGVPGAAVPSTSG